MTRTPSYVQISKEQKEEEEEKRAQPCETVTGRSLVGLLANIIFSSLVTVSEMSRTL